MPPKILGEHPFLRNDQGALKTRIATAFPRRRTLVTLPGIHAWQRALFLDHLNQERQEQGQPRFSADDEMAEYAQSVDLLMENDEILIRPDPDLTTAMKQSLKMKMVCPGRSLLRTIPAPSAIFYPRWKSSPRPTPSR